MTLFAPVEYDQMVFRVLLSAMAHPGRRFALSLPGRPPGDFDLLQALAGCLMDHEVSFAVIGRRVEPLARAIVRRTGARPTAIEQADFVFVPASSSNGRIRAAARGTLDYPDGGATVFYRLTGAGETSGPQGPPTGITLSGPGISLPAAPELEGLAPDEYRALADMNADYPMGIDAFVVADTGFVMAIPRSTRIALE